MFPYESIISFCDISRCESLIKKKLKVSNNRKAGELHNVYVVFALEDERLFGVDETFWSDPRYRSQVWVLQQGSWSHSVWWETESDDRQKEEGQKQRMSSHRQPRSDFLEIGIAFIERGRRETRRRRRAVAGFEIWLKSNFKRLKSDLRSSFASLTEHNAEHMTVTSHLAVTAAHRWKKDLL